MAQGLGTIHTRVVSVYTICPETALTSENNANQYALFTLLQWLHSTKWQAPQNSTCKIIWQILCVASYYNSFKCMESDQIQFKVHSCATLYSASMWPQCDWSLKAGAGI